MNWKKWTAIFVLSVVVLIIIYDIIAIMGGGTEASISHMLLIWSYKYPAFTFAMGFVCGHIFWRTLDTKDTKKIAEFVRDSGEVKNDIPKT